MSPIVRVVACLSVAGVTAIAAKGVSQQAGAGSAARLVGRVLADDAQRTAVRGAIVTASGENGPARSMLTDDLGGFDFAGLPAGRYSLSAAKRPFVTMAYGANRPDRAGASISVSPGQVIRDLVIQLPRGAVVTGALRDASGVALSGISVTAIRVPAASGVSASAAGTAANVTDDRGVYRIFGLAPGKYVVAATFRVTGAGGDIAVPSTADVDRLFADLRRTQRPASSASASASSAPAPAQPLPVVGYAPTFFPGTVSSADAGVIELAAGEERRADFVIVPVRTSSVEGVIQMHDGSPVPPVTPVLGAVGPPLPMTLGQASSLVLRPSADGRFKFAGVLPGKYKLSAFAQLRGGGPLGPSLLGLTDVVVNGADVTGVTVTMGPGVHASGRVVFDGTAAPPRDLATVRILFTSEVGTGAFFFNAGPMLLGGSATVSSDGSFDVPGLAPAPYDVSSAISGPWWLRSAILDGRDLLDGTLDVGGVDVSGVVLTFTDRHSELSGTLQTPATARPMDYVIVVFPTDRSMWRPGARRIKSARPATDGHFAIADLPGGDYLVATMTDVSPEDLGDPAFLAQLVSSSVKVSLADGERRTQNLRVVVR